MAACNFAGFIYLFIYFCRGENEGGLLLRSNTAWSGRDFLTPGGGEVLMPPYTGYIDLNYTRL